MRLIRPSWHHDIRVSDVALVTALLAMAYWNLWLDWDNYFPGFPPHLAIDSVTSVVATTSLLFRRRAPLTVMAITSLTMFGPDLVVATGPAYWGEWVPALVAAYSVAVYRGSWLSGLSLIAGCASYLVMRWRYPSEFAPAAAAVAWLAPVLIAISAGEAVRRLRDRSAVLARQVDEAEATQAEQAERAVIAERARIARDLHDVIAHSVTIMVVQAGAAEDTLDTDTETARRAIRSVQTAGRKALEEMKLLLGVLQPADNSSRRDPAPSLRRLESLIEPMRLAGLKVTVEANGLEHPISPAVDVSSYRVVQEALTNVLKHAPLAEVFVGVEISPERVSLEVRNGISGTAGAGKPGYGLSGLRERVLLHGGTIEVSRQPGGDFVLRAELPSSNETSG